ncbi:hypothetical protein HMPREF2532_02559 [Bacteroides ovatus]|nr:hypothetical protein HMPREF2532_02559 [Bacteroides ovatus]
MISFRLSKNNENMRNEMKKSLVLLQIPCYLFMFNYLIHGYSGVL